MQIKCPVVSARPLRAKTTVFAVKCQQQVETG